MARAHTHPAAGGPDDGAEATRFDLWRAMDLAVWAAVIVIAALGLEWLVGKLVRDRVTAQATRILTPTGTE